LFYFHSHFAFWKSSWVKHCRRRVGLLNIKSGLRRSGGSGLLRSSPGMLACITLSIRNDAYFQLHPKSLLSLIRVGRYNSISTVEFTVIVPENVGWVAQWLVCLKRTGTPSSTILLQWRLESIPANIGRVPACTHSRRTFDSPRRHHRLSFAFCIQEHY
jgi:hypothetical protein